LNIIGVDIGGTNTRVSLIKNASIISASRYKSFEYSESNTYIRKLIDTIRNLLKDDNIMPSCIVVAVPGTIENNTVSYAPNLGWYGVTLGNELEHEFHIPVFLENDANLATIGEYNYGSLKGASNSLLITLGTGVGGGAIINGELFRGSMGGAPEIGHIIINMGGRKCGCGMYGCLEAYASASGLIKTAKEKYILNKRDFPKSISAQKELPEKLFEDYKKGDALSIEIIEEYIEHLLTGLGSLISIFEPEKIALGGGIMFSHEILLPVLKSRIDDFTFPGLRGKCKICRAELLDKSAHLGAYALAELKIGKD